jgi:hypothetical protein
VQHANYIFLAQRQLPELKDLPREIDHYRCITTHGHNWYFGVPDKLLHRKLDIRSPEARVALLDAVSAIPAPGALQLRPKSKPVNTRSTKRRGADVKSSLRQEMSGLDIAGD